MSEQAKEILERIKRAIHAGYNPDFDFEVEHWENGNFDDSYDYGVDCGRQEAYGELLGLIENLEEQL